MTDIGFQRYHLRQQGRTPHNGYVIADECNERGNLNKTDHLCLNHNRPVVVLVQIATASAMPRDDGGGYNFASASAPRVTDEDTIFNTR